MPRPKNPPDRPPASGGTEANRRLGLAALLVPMPHAARESIRVAAAKNGLSMAAWARKILAQAAEKYSEKNGK